MSIILTADEIAEEYLFQDKIRLNFEECCDVLKNRGEVSEHKRAYQYIRETVVANMFRFSNDPEDRIEQWGSFLPNDKYVSIIGNRFDKILSEAGFQTKAFLSWAKKQKIVKTDSNGNAKIQTKINGRNVRCVQMDMEFEDADFEPLDDDNPFQ